MSSMDELEREIREAIEAVLRSRKAPSGWRSAGPARDGDRPETSERVRTRKRRPRRRT